MAVMVLLTEIFSEGYTSLFLTGHMSCHLESCVSFSACTHSNIFSVPCSWGGGRDVERAVAVNRLLAFAEIRFRVSYWRLALKGPDLAEAQPELKSRVPWAGGGDRPPANE